MDALNTLRNVLFHEMEVGIRSTGQLLQKVKNEDWEYRPAENMRSLKEVALHLVAIPEVDLAIMQENTQEAVQRIERNYEELRSADEMAEAMLKNYELFKLYFTSLSDKDFLTKKTTPFYLDQGFTQASWLTETVTHVFHHRAQLFNYMKQLGYDVNMFHLYV